jgi:hypothetical protein
MREAKTLRSTLTVTVARRKFRWLRGNFRLYCAAVAPVLAGASRLWATALDDIPARPLFVTFLDR